MENIILIILFYFIATVLSDKKKRRKVPPRPPGPILTQRRGNQKPIGFEIPKLEGAPPQTLPDEEGKEKADEEGSFQMQDDLWKGYPPQESLACADANAESVVETLADVQEKQPASALTPQTALQAIAWAEVLNRPKAHQKRHRRYR